MKKNRFVIGVTLLFAVWLLGCSNPRDTPLPEDLAKIDTIKPQLDKLTEDERKLFIGYAMRRSMQHVLSGLSKNMPVLSASTVGQAIDEQRKHVSNLLLKEAADKLVAAQVKAEREAALKVLQGLVSVILVSKRIDVERGYSGRELDRHIVIAFLFINNSSKIVAGVKGRIEVRDLFGDQISAFQISNDQTMMVGGTSTWTGGRSVKYTLGKNQDEKLVELTDDKFTLVWEPQAIVFTDGTKADLPK